LGLLISTVGWFVWNIFLAAVYPNKQTIYFVHHAFLKDFGRDPTWWTTIALTLSTVIVLELMVSALRRVYWPNDQDIMQRIELDKSVRSVMREHAAELGEAQTMTVARQSQSLHVKGLGDDGDERAQAGELSPVRGRSSDYEFESYQLENFNVRRPRSPPRTDSREELTSAGR